jgi:C4-type Zn-finger protein
MMPCPVCAGRMAYSGRRVVAPDVEDTVYACKRCGAELIRTSVHAQTEAKERKSAA